MSIEENKAVAGRWLAESWGKDFNRAIIDEIAAPDIRFVYSLDASLCGREELRALAENHRASFPDLSFWATPELTTEGDYVLGQLKGRGHPGQGCVRRLADRLAARRWRSTAVHEYSCAEGRERHDHRGDRPPRRPAAPRPHHSGLMAAITVPVRPGLAAEYLPEGGK